MIKLSKASLYFKESTFCLYSSKIGYLYPQNFVQSTYEIVSSQVLLILSSIFEISSSLKSFLNAVLILTFILEVESSLSTKEKVNVWKAKTYARKTTRTNRGKPKCTYSCK